MRTALILLFVFCVSAANAVDWTAVKKNNFRLAPVDPHIIGGDEVVAHSYPFQVGIIINGNSFCGGTLLTENYVLTAAHCGVVIYSATVILGAHNITNSNEITQVKIDVSEVIVHENYTKFYENDLALLRLSTPATLNDKIQRVTLPKRSDADINYAYQEVTAIGWGLTQDYDSPSINDLSGVLKGLNVSGILLDECEDYYNDYEENKIYVTEKNICTSGYKNQGTCNGDSGGPLLKDGVQIGVVSFGTTLCETCAPSAFTKLAKFLDWLQQNVEGLVIQ